MTEFLKQLRTGAIRGLGFFLIVGLLTSLTALLADKLTSFESGGIIRAGEINANFQKMPPVGAVIAWHKSFPGVTATLPDGWVECNGQTISDPKSDLNGQTVPNLNGDAGGADSPGTSGKYAMFLRGGTASGTGQMDAFQGHYHKAWYLGVHGFAGGSATGLHTIWRDWSGYPTTGSIQEPTADGSNGTPRTASETRPVNMTVVWIMRIK